MTTHVYETKQAVARKIRMHHLHALADLDRYESGTYEGKVMALEELAVSLARDLYATQPARRRFLEQALGRRVILRSTAEARGDS